MYKPETKNCQNCKGPFTIEPEDFAFYEKIKVPPPTFCPECRFARRLIWRNERSLYKRDCDLCHKKIISMYDSSVPFPVYCPECYKSDDWDRQQVQQEYDFYKNFFDQWHKLYDRSPKYAIRHIGECVDCQYTNYVDSSKNVYLSSSVVWGCENVFYSTITQTSKDVVDSDIVNIGNLLYENINTDRNYNCRYAYYSASCIDSSFIYNCRNCQNCIGCVNLQNKNFCIFNEQYSKEEYFKKIQDLDFGSYGFTKDFSEKFWKFYLQFPKKYAEIAASIESVGDNIKNSKNIKSGFNVIDSENLKYCYRQVKSKDSMDVSFMAAENAYEFAFGGSFNSSNIKFIIDGAPMLNEVEYCDSCSNSSNLFGCINLQNKQYCILNKQYSKEEYEKLVPKIKKHMDEMPFVDSMGRVYKYGEFFPSEFCPFGYNEAVINDLFHLEKEKILKLGYKWKNKEENKYNITLKADDLPDNIKDIDEEILKEVIECAVSKKPFKLTVYEFSFYKRMNIPMPRIHPDERYKERLKLRNPLKLWHRKCMKPGCTNEFETSYAPDRPEIVYCERCYQNEVY